LSLFRDSSTSSIVQAGSVQIWEEMVRALEQQNLKTETETLQKIKTLCKSIS
jgi:hypothetical protein